MYVFAETSEKIVMFLNVPFSRKTAAPSGLSDERSEEFGRVGSLPAERNI